MNAAAYLRVSSRAQTYAMQLNAVQLAARARGDRISRVYADTRTGGTLDRPELQTLRADARRGRVRRLYVFRLDRLTRTGIADTLALLDEFKRHGAEVVTVGDGINVSGPGAEIVIAALAYAAQLERVAINDRIAAARDRVEREGGRWGRPRRMSADDVARALKLEGLGRSQRKIAVALKLPRATVGRWLKKYRSAGRGKPRGKAAASPRKKVGY